MRLRGCPERFALGPLSLWERVRVRVFAGEFGFRVSVVSPLREKVVIGLRSAAPSLSTSTTARRRGSSGSASKPAGLR